MSFPKLSIDFTGYPGLYLLVKKLYLPARIADVVRTVEDDSILLILFKYCGKIEPVYKARAVGK